MSSAIRVPLEVRLVTSVNPLTHWTKEKDGLYYIHRYCQENIVNKSEVFSQKKKVNKSEVPRYREELKVGHGLQLCIPFEEKYLVKLSHRMFLPYLIDLYICSTHKQGCQNRDPT